MLDKTETDVALQSKQPHLKTELLNPGDFCKDFLLNITNMGMENILGW